MEFADQRLINESRSLAPQSSAGCADPRSDPSEGVALAAAISDPTKQGRVRPAPGHVSRLPSVLETFHRPHAPSNRRSLLRPLPCCRLRRSPDMVIPMIRRQSAAPHPQTPSNWSISFHATSVPKQSRAALLLRASARSRRTAAATAARRVVALQLETLAVDLDRTNRAAIGRRARCICCAGGSRDRGLAALL